MAMECGGLATANHSSLDDLFSTQTTEVDVGMEWLSIFVEDCFSNRGDCSFPAPTASTNQLPANTTSTPPPPFKPNNNKNHHSSSTTSLPQFAVAGKARSKRKRVAAAKGSRASFSGWSVPPFFPSSDPPLLDQAYWMADSELIAPKGGSQCKSHQEKEKTVVSTVKTTKVASEGGRRCSHCLSQRTPQWRAGPMGPKTLCNACGVRYKSGRLLPEYRPAKSPTFMSCLHSNSHKKVLEMRNGISGGGDVVEYSSAVTTAAAENR